MIVVETEREAVATIGAEAGGIEACPQAAARGRGPGLIPKASRGASRNRRRSRFRGLDRAPSQKAGPAGGKK